MQDQQTGTGEKDAGQEHERPDEVPLKWVGDIVITPNKEPAEPPRDKRIHPRRPMPPVPERPSEDKGER